MILLTIPGGMLRWSTPPPNLASEEQDLLDQRDEHDAVMEAWNRRAQQAREYNAQHWGRRFRHLGLLPALSAMRIPWLPNPDPCRCDKCRPAPLPLFVSLLLPSASTPDTETEVSSP